MCPNRSFSLFFAFVIHCDTLQIKELTAIKAELDPSIGELFVLRALIMNIRKPCKRHIKSLNGNHKISE